MPLDRMPRGRMPCGRALAYGAGMTVRVLPVTSDRFEDFADVVNPNRRATHCWCVTHRLGAPEIAAAGGREAAMRGLCAGLPSPGVLAYDEGEPVAWCHIGPREEMPRLVHSSVLTPVDEVPVWSIICVVVRGGRRKRGYTAPLIEGAVAYAASQGAPAVEAYPVDPVGRMDTTMAFVGTRSMFEPLGFAVIGQSAATASGMPRLVMRRTLT